MIATLLNNATTDCVCVLRYTFENTYAEILTFLIIFSSLRLANGAQIAMIATLLNNATTDCVCVLRYTFENTYAEILTFLIIGIMLISIVCEIRSIPFRILM